MKRVFLSLSFLSFLNAVYADVSTQSYLSAVQTPSVSQAKAELASLSKQKPTQKELAFFPVTSQLTPGAVKTQRIQKNQMALPFPLFVVSDDPRSLAWLKKNQAILEKFKAVGLVTNIPTQKAFDQLKNQFHLPMVPVSLSGLSLQIPVKHYPFLWHKGMIEQ